MSNPTTTTLAMVAPAAESDADDGSTNPTSTAAGCKGCCVCPHGAAWVVTTSILTYIACSANSYSMRYCDFVDAEGVGSLGFFTAEAQDSREDSAFPCVSYSKEDKDYLMDGPFQIGKLFAVLAVIFGLIGLIATCSLCCTRFANRALVAMVGLYVACGICSMLSLVILASDFGGLKDNYNFELAGGGFISIAAAGVWLINAAIFGICVYFTTIDLQQQQQQQQQQCAVVVIDDYDPEK